MIRMGHVELPDPFQRKRVDPDVELEFRSLTTEQKDQLSAFFKADVRGMAISFGYEDSRGVKIVRFNEATICFVERTVNAWDVTLRLILV